MLNVEEDPFSKVPFDWFGQDISMNLCWNDKSEVLLHVERNTHGLNFLEIFDFL